MSKRIVSDETRAQMSEARKAWWNRLTPEEKEQYALKQRGQKHPKTSEALRGKPKSPEHVEKLRNGKIVPCTNCGKEVYRHQYLLEKFPNAFCSRECSISWRTARQRERANKETCLECGKEFLRGAARKKYNRGNHYCSKECAVKARTGEKSEQWKGGRSKRRDGYIDIAEVLVPDQFKSMVRKQGKVMEHRLVMAQHIGRPLEDWEVVHHINGIRDDNRIENLELHPYLTHNGITAATNKEVARLKREIAELQEKLSKLESKESP